MMKRTVAITIAIWTLLGCSGDGDRPGPAPSDGGSGGSSGSGGAGVDGGKQCADDGHEQGIGKTISCGGAYCIPGIGCKADCEGNHECRPGYECQQVSANVTACVLKSN